MAGKRIPVIFLGKFRLVLLEKNPRVGYNPAVLPAGIRIYHKKVRGIRENVHPVGRIIYNGNGPAGAGDPCG